MRDDKKQFDDLNTAIYGINPDGAAAHADYVRLFNFNFPLLADTDRSISRSYGCLKENGTSVERTVYIIDKEGIIRYAQRGMPSDEELLQALRVRTKITDG